MRNEVKILSLLFVFFLCFTGSRAQFVPPGGNNNPNSPAVVDGTTQMDSIQRREDSLRRARPPHVRMLSVNQYFWNRKFRSEPKVELGKMQFTDAAESEGNGFLQSLGQMGKPYRRFQYGLPTSYFVQKGFVNPLTGAEDFYVLDHSQIPYFDTRTPYVNVDFNMGRRDLAQLGVVISQNIGPLLNATLWYKRRQATGPYSNNVTDHKYLGFSTRLQSRSDRYHAFLGGNFNELSDQINGGVAQVLIFNGTPEPADFDSSFFKETMPVSLADANLLRKYRGLIFSHGVRLYDDTLNTPSRVLLFQVVERDEYLQEYTDSAYSTTGLELFPVYPTLRDSTDDQFYELATVRRWIYTEGFSYQLNTEGFEMSHRVTVTNEINGFRHMEEKFIQDKFVTRAEGNLAIRSKPFELGADWDARRAASNFFEVEHFATAHAFLSFPGEKKDYAVRETKWLKPKDTLDVPVMRRPFTLHGFYTRNNINPTLQNAFYAGYLENDLQARRDLLNQQVQLVRAGFEWRTRDSLHEGVLLPGSRLYVGGYVTGLRNPIYYNDTMLITQDSTPQWRTWRGLEADVLLRFGKLFLHGKGAIQQYTGANVTSEDSSFHSWMPNWYGRGGFYYENRDLNIAAILRVGVEVVFFSDYKGWLYEPSSTQFYPQRKLSLGDNFRVDAHFAFQIKKAYLFFRGYNLAEGLFRQGFYTTPYYPMQERQFMFGLNWSFFD